MLAPHSIPLLLLLPTVLSQSCGNLPRWEEIRDRDIHRRSDGIRRSERMPMDPFGGMLQIASPPPPHEKDWVMVAGNETQVDQVLAASLGMGGRLVSIGHFSQEKQVNYYAVMHRYKGPVFIKPSPMSLDELLKAVRDNEVRDLALTQVCGNEANGKVSFMTYWEYVPGIVQQIWFPGSPGAEKQRIHFESIGLRLTYLCGFAVKGQPRYVGVWQNLPLNRAPYEAHYGVSMQKCLAMNEDLSKKNYVATVFSVFQLGTELLCSGIWEHAPGFSHFIRVGNDLAKMYGEFLGNPRILPRQMSHYFSGPKTTQYSVLWSDIDTRRFPNPPALWNLTSHIPSSFLRGSSQLLRPHQSAFVVDRIENFMRTYDLPALSIAIAKDERLKFAAGFGYTDLRTRELTQPDSLFRIGSVSKPITAASVLLLVDKGLIDLERRVFGPGGILGMDYATSAGYGRYIDQITTRQLMEHTTGGWDNEEGDVAWSMPKASADELIRAVLVAPLPGPPGRKWIYSNFGYLLLGKIIEKTSRMKYEDFVNTALLSPSGATNSFVARSTIAERRPKESIYYMSGTSIGFDPYELLAPERIGPWGGWVSNPIQLLKFVSAVDGTNVRNDLISRRSVIEWSTPSLASNRSYGLGWSVNVMGFNGWQHDGRMPGASAMLVRIASGHSMAITTNKEFVAREFFHDMAYMLHHIVHQCEWWNDLNDLFAYTNDMGAQESVPKPQDHSVPKATQQVIPNPRKIPRNEDPPGSMPNSVLPVKRPKQEPPDECERCAEKHGGAQLPAVAERSIKTELIVPADQQMATPPGENGDELPDDDNSWRPPGMTDEEYEIRRDECRTINEGWELDTVEYGSPRRVHLTSDDEWSPADEQQSSAPGQPSTSTKKKIIHRRPDGTVYNRFPPLNNRQTTAGTSNGMNNVAVPARVPTPTDQPSTSASTNGIRPQNGVQSAVQAAQKNTFNQAMKKAKEATEKKKKEEDERRQAEEAKKKKTKEEEEEVERMRMEEEDRKKKEEEEAERVRMEAQEDEDRRKKKKEEEAERVRKEAEREEERKKKEEERKRIETEKARQFEEEQKRKKDEEQKKKEEDLERARKMEEEDRKRREEDKKRKKEEEERIRKALEEDKRKKEKERKDNEELAEGIRKANEDRTRREQQEAADWLRRQEQAKIEKKKQPSAIREEARQPSAIREEARRALEGLEADVASTRSTPSVHSDTSSSAHPHGGKGEEQEAEKVVPSLDPKTERERKRREKEAELKMIAEEKRKEEEKKLEQRRRDTAAREAQEAREEEEKRERRLQRKKEKEEEKKREAEGRNGEREEARTANGDGEQDEERRREEERRKKKEMKRKLSTDSVDTPKRKRGRPRKNSYQIEFDKVKAKPIQKKKSSKTIETSDEDSMDDRPSSSTSAAAASIASRKESTSSTTSSMDRPPQSSSPAMPGTASSSSAARAATAGKPKHKVVEGVDYAGKDAKKDIASFGRIPKLSKPVEDPQMASRESPVQRPSHLPECQPPSAQPTRVALERQKVAAGSERAKQTAAADAGRRGSGDGSAERIRAPTVKRPRDQLKSPPIEMGDGGLGPLDKIQGQMDDENAKTPKNIVDAALENRKSRIDEIRGSNGLSGLSPSSGRSPALHSPTSSLGSPQYAMSPRNDGRPVRPVQPSQPDQQPPRSSNSHAAPAAEKQPLQGQLSTSSDEPEKTWLFEASSDDEPRPVPPKPNRITGTSRSCSGPDPAGASDAAAAVLREQAAAPTSPMPPPQPPGRFSTVPQSAATPVPTPPPQATPRFFPTVPQTSAPPVPTPLPQTTPRIVPTVPQTALPDAPTPPPQATPRFFPTVPQTSAPPVPTPLPQTTPRIVPTVPQTAIPHAPTPLPQTTPRLVPTVPQTSAPSVPTPSLQPITPHISSAHPAASASRVPPRNWMPDLSNIPSETAPPATHAAHAQTAPNRSTSSNVRQDPRKRIVPATTATAAVGGGSKLALDMRGVEALSGQPSDHLKNIMEAIIPPPMSRPDESWRQPIQPVAAPSARSTPSTSTTSVHGEDSRMTGHVRYQGWTQLRRGVEAWEEEQRRKVAELTRDSDNYMLIPVDGLVTSNQQRLATFRRSAPHHNCERLFCDADSPTFALVPSPKLWRVDPPMYIRPANEAVPEELMREATSRSVSMTSSAPSVGYAADENEPTTSTAPRRGNDTLIELRGGASVAEGSMSVRPGMDEGVMPALLPPAPPRRPESQAERDHRADFFDFASEEMLATEKRVWDNLKKLSQGAIGNLMKNERELEKELLGYHWEERFGPSNSAAASTTPPAVSRQANTVSSSSSNDHASGSAPRRHDGSMSAVDQRRVGDVSIDAQKEEEKRERLARIRGKNEEMNRSRADGEKRMGTSSNSSIASSSRPTEAQRQISRESTTSSAATVTAPSAASTSAISQKLTAPQLVVPILSTPIQGLTPTDNSARPPSANSRSSNEENYPESSQRQSTCGAAAAGVAAPTAADPMEAATAAATDVLFTDTLAVLRKNAGRAAPAPQRSAFPPPFPIPQPYVFPPFGPPPSNFYPTSMYPSPHTPPPLGPPMAGATPNPPPPRKLSSSGAVLPLPPGPSRPAPTGGDEVEGRESVNSPQVRREEEVPEINEEPQGPYYWRAPRSASGVDADDGVRAAPNMPHNPPPFQRLPNWPTTTYEEDCRTICAPKLGDATIDEVRQYFESFGPIEEIRMKDSLMGWIAFVRYKKLKDVMPVRRHVDHKIKGNKILVMTYLTRPPENSRY